MVRNLGGIANPNLYIKCCTGTKLLIDHYIGVVVSCLNKLAEIPTADLPLQFPRPASVLHSALQQTHEKHETLWQEPPSQQSSTDDQLTHEWGQPPSPPPLGYDHREKYSIFVEFLRIFGRSALVLTGGLSLGMHASFIYDSPNFSRIIPSGHCEGTA
jgi:Domain of unknown function (DUF3336)